MILKTTTLLATSCLFAPLVTGSLFAQDSSTDTQDRQTPRTPDSDAHASKNHSSSPAMLSKLEGIWEVDVEVNPSLWQEAMDGSRTSDAPQRGDADRPADAGDAFPTNVSSRTPRGGDDTAETPETSAHHGPMGPMEGVTEAQTLFGGNVLSMATILSPDGDTQSPGWQPEKDGKGMMRSLSYFSFDPETEQYQAVFLSDMDGEMHHAQGRYDAENDRIVFGGSSAAAVPRKAESSNQGRTINASTRSMQNARSDAHFARETAVLRMLDESSFEVTMYVGAHPDVATAEALRNGLSHGTDSSHDASPKSAPTETSPVKGTIGTLPANVLYRATYQRASAERVDECERAMRDDEARQRTAKASGLKRMEGATKPGELETLTEEAKKAARRADQKWQEKSSSDASKN